MKKPKVLFLPSWYPTLEKPLNGLFFMEQAEVLSEIYEINILFVGFKPTAKKKSIQYVLSSPYNQVELAGSIKGKGYEVHLSPFIGKENKVKKIVGYYDRLFRDFIKEYGKPDVIHAHGGLYAGIASTYLKNKYRIPNLITEHHPVLLNDFDIGSAKAYVQALNEASATSTVSNYSQRMLMMHAEQTFPFVHGNLVNEEVYHTKGKAKPGFIIGYIGYPSFNKDPFTFITAMELLKKKYSFDFRAKMVIPDVNGDFSYQDIRNFIAEKGVAQEIEVIPGLGKEALVDFYNSLSALVSTSYSETFGLVAAEAAACGVPVVATRSGGVEDFMDERIGFLVKLKDAGEIVRCLALIKEKPERFSVLEMRNKILNAYGKQAFKEKISKIYELLINKEQKEKDGK